MLNKKRRELANVQVADAEQKQRDIINCWRDAPEIPSEEEYSVACFQKPFEFKEPTPIALNEPEERRKFTNRLKKDVEWKYPMPMGKKIYGYGIGVVVGILSGAITKLFLPLLHISGPLLVGLLLGLSAVGIVNKILSNQWNIHLQNLAEEFFRREWPNHWEQLVADYKAAVDTFESQRAEAKTVWETNEIERTIWAKRLIDGDVEAIKDSVADTIGDLDFPFDAQCGVALSSAELVYLHLDLPEVEDVIPETRSSVLKDGRIKQVKRSATERYSEYSTLVFGLAILLACAAFSAGPTLKTTSIAAYTQRKKRGTDAIIDNYVYEVSFDRTQVETLALSELDPVSFFSTIGAKFEQKNTLELKTLPAPSWVVDLLDK